MKKFSPQLLLSALGAGGIAVSGFAFLNYTFQHGPGLITFAQLHNQNFPLWKNIFYGFFESYMIIFSLIHFTLLFILGKKYLAWKKTPAYLETKKNPLTASAILIPYLVLFMSLNVIIGTVRYFIPVLSNNLQMIMPFGFIAWLFVWTLLMKTEIQLLSATLTEKYDFSKINFSWMLHPFSLGMATVTGTGISAMANNPFLASSATFISMISLTMALFLLLLKSTNLFRNYFSAESLPTKEYLPSLLNLVPIATVLGISFFRLGHYFERNSSAHLDSFFTIITTLTLAFETWYLFFGVYLLKNYLTQDFQKEFHPSQWSLICPFVAYAVMGSFTYATFFKNPIFLPIIFLVTLFFLILFFLVAFRQLKSSEILK